MKTSQMSRPRRAPETGELRMVRNFLNACWGPQGFVRNNRLGGDQTDDVN